MGASVATIDFETRSACDLKKHGTWRYSTHPSTQILCLCFRLPDWEAGRVEWWHPAIASLGLEEDCSDVDALQRFKDYIRGGNLIEAHNVWFEFCIWQNLLVPAHGWPPVGMGQWRCSAAKAATHALPRALDKAADALRLAYRKDVDGKKVMRKMAKPRKLLKREAKALADAELTPPEHVWHESREQLMQLIDYCKLDVLTEEALSKALPDLLPQEQELFLLDLTMNLRGFQIDRYAVRMALQLVHREAILMNKKLSVLTEGVVTKSTQRARVLLWLDAMECWLPDTKGATLDDALAHGDLLPEGVLPVLQIVRALGRSSTAKYTAMKRWWDTLTGRIHGGLLYHGASTGRWSGKGIQPHNFPKGVVKGEIGDDGDYILDDKGKIAKVEMARLWALIKEGKRDQLITRFGGVMETLSTALRGAIVAAKGKQLFVADYSAIEARVLLWFAEDEEHLDIFRRGEDIYVDMAKSIGPAADRALGKIAVLGLGYQMGAAKFFATCQAWGVPVTEELAEATVTAYRAKFWKVKQLWADVEAAAIDCLRTRREQRVGCVRFVLRGQFLYCELPSGRLLAYAYPRLQERTTHWGQIKTGLTYVGVDPKTHQWRRQHSYGGLLVENIVQAISRDIMAEAMLRCEAAGYPVILSVHDELIAEAAEGSLDEYIELLTELPDWASGAPIAAEGWVGIRYRK